MTTKPRDIRRMMRGIAFLAVLVAAFSGESSAKPIASDQFTITDGDTINVKGARKGTRLVGFNAPETFTANCGKESEVGIRATKRLRELVATSNMDLEIVRCACKPGTENTKGCNYGRSCGILRADGRDVGQILISEGLAVPFVCGATRCPRTPRPWCK